MDGGFVALGKQVIQGPDKATTASREGWANQMTAANQPLQAQQSFAKLVELRLRAGSVPSQFTCNQLINIIAVYAIAVTSGCFSLPSALHHKQIPF